MLFAINIIQQNVRKIQLHIEVQYYVSDPNKFKSQ